MIAGCRGTAWSEPPPAVGAGTADRRRVHGTPNAAGARSWRATRNARAARSAVSSTAPHQALYRRWRAQTFAEIVGPGGRRRDAAQRVSAPGGSRTRTCSSGRAAPARPPSPGSWPRRSTARTLHDGEPCDACPSCVAIREGRALDVDRDRRRLEQPRRRHPRAAAERSSPRPSDLRRKVFIVDEVQRITQGWDVLLKTLEEPPDSRRLHLLHDRQQPGSGRRSCRASSASTSGA